MEKDKKKILIISECFYPENFKINDVALSWVKKDYNIDVLTLVPSYPLGKIPSGYKNKFFQKDEYKGCRIFRLPTIVGYKDNIFKKLLKYLNFLILGSIFVLIFGRRYKYIFGFNISALTNMVPAVLAKIVYKKRVVLWVQDIWPDSVYAFGFRKTSFLKFFLNLIVKFVYRNVDSFALSSKGFETKIKTFLNKDVPMHYAPNWAEDIDMQIKNEYQKKRKKILEFTFAGNIGKFQNLDIIVSTYLSLPREYKNKSRLNIIGDGSSLQRLKKIANDSPNVVFHGRKEVDEMRYYYQISDFLIISLIDKPVFSHLVPSKLQTYILAKKPILAIIKGETADIVLNNKLGLHANPSDKEKILDIFMKCIDMEEHEIKELTKNNENLIATTYNKEKTIEKLFNITINQEYL